MQNSYHNLNKDIGERIKELRIKKEKEDNIKITQEMLAEQIGSYQSTISQYEHNTKEISVLHLVQLADYFGVTYHYLITGENPPDNRLDILKNHIKLEYKNYTNNKQHQEYLSLDISKPLVDYLYQSAQAEYLSSLPQKARDAWYEKMKHDFNCSKEKEFLSFIPFPAESVTRNQEPACWIQSVIKNTISFFNTIFNNKPQKEK
ncbi:helix-turn-helix domain-containing protein [Eubacterium ramulus]|uniref:helix-turn-helix domain-containing protein n=1 Tax=Eubacterium ramulus TaxID=39490 RepID=UPI0012B08C1B